MSSEFLGNASANIRRFLSRRLNMNEGMNELIRRFYRSITDDDPLPIPYWEIVLTSRIMDAVLAQISPLSAARASR
jgi:hypothetical protein